MRHSCTGPRPPDFNAVFAPSSTEDTEAIASPVERASVGGKEDRRLPRGHVENGSQEPHVVAFHVKAGVGALGHREGRRVDDDQVVALASLSLVAKKREDIAPNESMSLPTECVEGGDGGALFDNNAV